MGKSKKTRWRTFEIGGSQDDTTTYGDAKGNVTELDSPAPVSSQKYSLILGDNSTFNRNSYSHNTFKSRGHYNKENYYNQRGRPSWQRGTSYKSPIVNGKEEKPEKDDKASLTDAKGKSSTEPLKFNEDEYTRITTPRQDVLFKKGYLSRMTNKTANNLSATVNSMDSTTTSSTITTSDPDSSVSTLSPATTPSMDYGHMDSVDYSPMYYPGYYDENGMLVIPMYNGYNYYPPNGSSASSPVYLMPYHYQYDPFYMSPNEMQPLDGEDTTEDKTVMEDSKENNQHDENQNTAISSSSDDGADNNHSDDAKEKDKRACKELIGHGEEGEFNREDIKQSFSNYQKEIYPAYVNGFYNNFYYYNGVPSAPPPKFKRRKRFLNSRNSQQQRSAETTTDYSEDEATTNRNFVPRYQNTWTHCNSYNHSNGKFQRFHFDQNDNLQNGFHLNVDVQEFHPRTQTTASKQEIFDESVENSKITESQKVLKTRQLPSKNCRTSKKEIFEGIISMEQQNIDLTKHHETVNASHDEWNIIKNGKKVKVPTDSTELPSTEAKEIKQEKLEAIQIEGMKAQASVTSETVKKSISAPNKSKKSKSKGKKKKSHLLTKLDGFEITEPEFKSHTDAVQGIIAVDAIIMNENEHVENVVLTFAEENNDQHKNTESPVNQAKTTWEQKSDAPEVNDLLILNNAVIDISDDDIRRIPLELQLVSEDGISLQVESSKKPHVLKTSFTTKTADLGLVIEDRLEQVDKDQNVLNEKTNVEHESIHQEVEPLNVLKKEDFSFNTNVSNMKDDELNAGLFQDSDFFNDRTNIAALERDLMENLKLYDDDITLKSPTINPLYDFPITSAVHKWLQAKQNESFDNLFHVQNFQKLNDRFCQDNEDEDTASDISDKEMKSETDSDYASDSHAKAIGSTHAKVSSKCNKLIAKESFCALM